MHLHIRGFMKASLLAMAVIGVAGCGNLSHQIAKDGSSAEQLVWPKPDDTTPMHKGGTSPSLESLRAIHAGQNKKQISALIGYPHFSEGVSFHSREWNYLFHLPTADGGEMQCQYKVLYDKDKLAQSFYWEPAACAELLEQKPAVAAAPAMETFTLSADALFDFDKADIKSEGLASLDQLAEQIQQRGDQVESIRILGYTDMLGDEGYNRLLSQQRAYAALKYLASKGVPEALMTAAGLGEDAPLKLNCQQTSHDALVACLAPNRRIDVQVFGHGE